MLPQEILKKLDALELHLRPFWDRSRAIVAMQPAEYCILSYGHLADIKSPQEKVVSRTEAGLTNDQGCSVATSLMAVTQPLLVCVAETLKM